MPLWEAIEGYLGYIGGGLAVSVTWLWYRLNLHIKRLEKISDVIVKKDDYDRDRDELHRKIDEGFGSLKESIRRLEARIDAIVDHRTKLK